MKQEMTLHPACWREYQHPCGVLITARRSGGSGPRPCSSVLLSLHGLYLFPLFVGGDRAQSVQLRALCQRGCGGPQCTPLRRPRCPTRTAMPPVSREVDFTAVRQPASGSLSDAVI